MAIKHPFVSGVADEAGTTRVRPLNWNADHTIDNDTITYAQIQNVSVADRLLGWYYAARYSKLSGFCIECSGSYHHRTSG